MFNEELQQAAARANELALIFLVDIRINDTQRLYTLLESHGMLSDTHTYRTSSHPAEDTRLGMAV